MAIVASLLITCAHAQSSPDHYLASLNMPCYPPLARQAHHEGVAKVKIEVGSDGKVISAQAVEGSALLGAAAAANVQSWTFAAAQGQDLSKLKTTVVFEYKLEGEPGWDRCALRVVFGPKDRVEVFAHPPVTTTNYAPKANAERPLNPSQ
jgi:TonB family protein